MQNPPGTPISLDAGVGNTDDDTASELGELAAAGRGFEAPLTDEPVEAVKSTQDPNDIGICEQGPCVHFVKIQRRSELRDGALLFECRCSLGVDLMIDRTDQRAKDIPQHLRLLISPISFPETCNQWKPFSDAELEDTAARRIAAQDRVAALREIEAARLAAGPIVPMEPAHDMGPDVPEAAPETIPQLPDELELSPTEE